MDRFTGLLGIITIIAIAWSMSKHKKHFPWKIVAWGLGLQFSVAVFLFTLPPGRAFFVFINDLAVQLLSYSTEGAKFVFGALATGQIQVKEGAAPGSDFFFAFQVITTVIFFSSLIAVLYHFKVMQKVVKSFAWVMEKTMKISGAEALAASANIFFGQTEAPITVKPYIDDMTDSEIMSMMSGGFATVAGAVLIAYIGLLSGFFPDIAGHLITASVLSAPAAIMLAKIMVPELDQPKTLGLRTKVYQDVKYGNVLDAAVSGASSGIQLALNIAAMLIAFIALLALLNAMIAYVFGLIGYGHIDLQYLLGLLHYPLTLLLGVPVEDAMQISKLLSEKLVLTEFVAYLNLAEILREGGPAAMSEKSKVIATYALCGFANFASIGIQIGGIKALAPNKAQKLAQFGLKAMIAGALAAYLTACIAGMLYDIQLF